MTAKSLLTSAPIYKRIQESWVLLCQEELLTNTNFSIITLPQPATKKPSKYSVDILNKKVFEVVTFDETHRSWFIGETVKSDGSILILTPVNPIFLLLPYLKEQCCNRAIPLEDLLCDKNFDAIRSIVSNDDILKVADLKGPEDLRAYKYNEEKTLAWLTKRVQKVAAHLKSKGIHVRSGAVSATFIASHVEQDTVDEEFYLKYAHGLISEYLEDDLIEALEKKFNFAPEMVESLGSKRKSDVEETSKSKKVKCDTIVENIENDSSPINIDAKKPKSLSAKEKARQKAASGTKTISTFFSKK